MPEGTIQLPADSTGKKLRTETVVVGADTVHQEVVTLADSAGTFADVAKLANLDIALSALRDALETITVANADFPDAAVLAKVEAVRALLAATLTVVGTVAVSNFPATQPVSGPLTDAQLRATPVPVDVSDTGFNVNNFPADQLVHATNLDLATTALRDALRGASNKTLTDIVTALASVPVTGTFFPATQPVSATDLDIRDLALTDSVRQTTRAMLPLSVNKTAPLTDDVLVAVSPGSRLRLLRNFGHCDPALGSGTYPVVTIKLGATTVYADKLESGLPWAETVCFEGADGDDLTISLTGTATVYLNLRYEVFPA